MEREQVLDLYEWAPGVCFRHPGKGTLDTAVVKELHPRGDDVHEIRACRDCVVMMEDIRREAVARAGGEYEPGHAGEAPR